MGHEGRGCGDIGVVVTWNVAGRVRSVAAQAEALATRPAAIVALQEVRATALAAWEERLAALGYPHILAALAPGGPARPPERRLGVLVASREPIDARPMPQLPWPERYLVARTRLDGTVVDLHNLHAPISSKAEQVKVRTLETVRDHLAAPAGVPRILVGDLNTPQYESREGEVRSFARTRAGRIRPTHGERHDRAELGIVVGLAEHGYADAFRVLHGYGRRDRSWLYPHRGTGYRLDHIFVRGLGVVACEYEHAWRDAGLSDHAAMWAQLIPTGRAAAAAHA
jgi:endonuclease/exonuclease/phosphatase family metal-dependent hydrolase